ncbi:unnamed protein product [Urochloa humidicola]
MAAAEWMTRAWALAIATAACVGLPCALVYEIVRAAAARRSGATATAAALSVFVVVWVVATAAYYPRVCADILRLRGRQQQARHGRLFVAARGHGGMDALPREPPAGFGGGGVRVVAGDTPPERCAVCLCDVVEVETAAWLPACLHVFHRQCIDQWLHKHGHSTCPICRCDAFAAPPLLRVLQMV